METSQNGLLSPRKPPGGISNVFKSRCHQNLSNTKLLYFLEKNMKFANWLDPKDRGIFCIFRKKSRFFDKLIIKNVQNRVLYENNWFLRPKRVSPWVKYWKLIQNLKTN